MTRFKRQAELFQIAGPRTSRARVMGVDTLCVESDRIVSRADLWFSLVALSLAMTGARLRSCFSECRERSDFGLHYPNDIIVIAILGEAAVF